MENSEISWTDYTFNPWWGWQLIQECKERNVAVHMKQLSQADFPDRYRDFSQFPPAFQLREFPR